MSSHFTVGIFIGSSPEKYSSLAKEEYQLAYWELAQAVQAQGGELFLTDTQDSYLGKGDFSHGWTMTGPGQFQQRERPHADVVYNKSHFVSDGTVPLFNHEKLEKICTHKFLTYQTFPALFATTLLVRSAEEFSAALAQMKTQLVVVKPVDGAEGYGVLIEPIESLRQKTFSYPVIVQEFLDTSVGIPDIVDGTHDFRVVMFNDAVLYSYFRTPPPGKLTANVAQGGKFSMIDPEKIPAVMLEIAKKVDAHMAQFGPRFYSIDMGMTANGPRLIELNSKPGLLPNRDDPVFITLKRKLAQTFKQMAAQH